MAHIDHDALADEHRPPSHDSEFAPAEKRLRNAASGFFRELEIYGGSTALIENGRHVTYEELARLADEAASRLPTARSLVAIRVDNDLASVAAYLGCLRAGHAIILVAREGGEAILSAFSPDVVLEPTTGAMAVSPHNHALHPALAVMLSTSGSTGSPKLVRLTSGAVDANARAIASYLALTGNDRAITTLPIHYSFGLSILNSHLAAGASVVLTNLSVTHPDFAALLAETRPTSLSGVPYTYDLIERSGLALPDTIRTMTQAGGRLPPERVAHWARLMAERGGRFFAMYGQTEATARISYLPPEQALAHPDCIGVAVPGGELRLFDAGGQPIEATETEGELAYRGPNVMMGYALGPDDLARGAEIEWLKTGDMAVRNDAGLFRIVGRASRFSKIAGLRIGHDGIEALLARWGVEGAHATGTDAVLAVVVPAGAKVEGLAQRVAQSCKVPANAVVVLEQDAPRLPSGKVDYKSIVRLAEAERARAAEATRGSAQGAILAGYRSAFNRADIDPEQSFSSLGGDSLTFVNAMLAIEDVLGAVPAGWETMSIASLEALASDAPAPSAAGGARAAPKLQPVESEVWLRMLALLLVMTGHAALNADTLFLRGGSGLLLLLAGYSMARFARPQLELGRTWSPLGGLFARVMLPTLLLIALIYPVSNAERDPGWFLFLSTWTVDVRGPLFALWFVDTLVQITAAMCLLYWVPQVRRWSRAGPFPFALALLSVAWALKLFVPTIYDDVNPRSLTADAWAYIFILGWCAAVAQGTRNKAAVVLLGFALASADYGLGSPRSLWLGLALVALMAGPFLKLPSLGRQAVMRFSAAGFFIYLAHIVVHHLVHFVLHISNIWVTIPLVLALSIAGGIIAERIWAWLLRMAASRKWRNAPWRQQKAGGA